MRPQDIGIAVIGSGYCGESLVRNYHELGVLKLICDKDETVAETHFTVAREALLAGKYVYVEKPLNEGDPGPFRKTVLTKIRKLVLCL